MFTIYPHRKMIKVAINRLIHRVIHIIHRHERVFLWKTWDCKRKGVLLKYTKIMILRKTYHKCIDTRNVL